MERSQATYLFRTCPSTTTSAGGQLFCRIALRRRRRRRQARKPLVAIARTRRRRRKEPTRMDMSTTTTTTPTTADKTTRKRETRPADSYCDHCIILYIYIYYVMLRLHDGLPAINAPPPAH